MSLMDAERCGFGVSAGQCSCLQRSNPGDKLELTNCHAHVVMWDCLNMQPPLLAAPQSAGHSGWFPSSAEMVRM